MIEIIISVNPVTSSSHVFTNFFQNFFFKIFFNEFFSPNFLCFQTATIQSYRSQDCCKYTNSDYDCNTNNVVIDDSVLCAGSTTQKIGVCFGDSGGPLIYFNGSHNLLGQCI